MTTAADWSQLRKAPSSWAELEGDNIILTVPSAFVRHLEAPETLMGLWHDIMKGVADLAALPNKLLRKERIVTDVQISHGKLFLSYMNRAVHVNFLLHLYILDFMKNRAHHNLSWARGGFHHLNDLKWMNEQLIHY